MNKKLFSDLIASVREAGRIHRGEVKPSRVYTYSATRVRELRQGFKPSRIVAVRKRLKMSQAEFANVMLIPKATLQSWEQGRRKPEGPALVLIEVITRNPDAVVNALHKPSA
jgi:putative transcriptional regulator